MGKGKGKGGGGGGGVKLPRFMRGFASRIFGPSQGMTDALNQVAIARGLRDADELVGRLVGKQLHQVSFKEALDLLAKECSLEEFAHIGRTSYYRPGKGYHRCNKLLKRYVKGINESGDPDITRIHLTELKKYCGYTDDELNSLV